MTKKERNTLIDMYRSLEQLPGELRKGQGGEGSTLELEREAMGADKARVRVYHWLRGLGFPTGGR